MMIVSYSISFVRQDLKVKEAEEVTLVGTFVQEYADDLVPGARRDLQWLGESLLLVSELSRCWLIEWRLILPAERVAGWLRVSGVPYER